MRPPFDGIQILGQRLERPAESFQFDKGLSQSTYQTKN